MNRLLCVLIILFSGCQQQSQETHYKEVTVELPQASAPAAVAPVDQTMPPDQAMPANPHAGLDMPMFTWDVPQGWQQEAGTGMRLATFHLVADAKAIDCSVVAMGGMAGGLQANLRRWMGQLGVQATDKQLNTLIASAPSIKIKSGQEGKIFDFTSIQSKSTAKSMIAVMVTMDEATLFVKMAGTVKTVSKNKNDFLKLVSSIEYHAPSADTSTPGANINPTADPHAGLDMSTMGPIVEAPTSQNILTWTNPQGWVQLQGTHMRMVTFHSSADPNAIDCYIIGLAGPAGGLEANLQRWLGQLGLQPSEDNVNQLLASAQISKTKDGLEAKVFDFTVLQAQGGTSDQSMIVAMIPVDQTTIFVKMTGTIESVKQNKENFIKLLRSIARK